MGPGVTTQNKVTGHVLYCCRGYGAAVEMTASKHYLKGHKEDMTEVKGMARGGIRGVFRKSSERYTRHGDSYIACVDPELEVLWPGPIDTVLCHWQLCR